MRNDSGQVESFAFTQMNNCMDTLAQIIVRKSNYSRSRHMRMLFQHSFHFGGIYVGAPPYNQIGSSICKEQVAVLINMSKIANPISPGCIGIFLCSDIFELCS